MIVFVYVLGICFCHKTTGIRGRTSFAKKIILSSIGGVLAHGSKGKSTQIKYLSPGCGDLICCYFRFLCDRFIYVALNATRFDSSCKPAVPQNTVWSAPYGVVPGLFTLRPDRCRGSVKVAQTDDDDASVSNVNHVKFSLRRGAAPDLISRYVQVFILKRFFWLELLNYCWRCCSSNGAEFVIKMLVDLCDCCDVDFLFIFIENDPGYCPRLSQV